MTMPEQFFVRAYTPEDLQSFLAQSEKTNKEFKSEVIRLVQTLCNISRGKVSGCVMNIHQDQCMTAFGMYDQRYDELFTDALTEMEFRLCNTGWQGMNLIRSPGQTRHDVRDFCSFALQQLFTND